MSDPHHPIWRLIQTAMYLFAAFVFLWMNASNFDHTEWKTLIELGAVIGGAELIKAKLSQREPPAA